MIWYRHTETWQLSYFTHFAERYVGNVTINFDSQYANAHTPVSYCERSSDRQENNLRIQWNNSHRKEERVLWLGQGVLPSSEEHTGCIQRAAKQWFTIDQLKRVLFHEMAKFNWPLLVLCKDRGKWLISSYSLQQQYNYTKRYIIYFL